MRVSRTIILLPAGLIAVAPVFAPADAQRVSKPAINKFNFNPETEYNKGIKALEAGRYGEAKAAFGRILNVLPDDANTNYVAGLAAAGLGDLGAARRFYERAIKAREDMFEARRELGVTYVKLGDRSKAQTQLDWLKAYQGQCGTGCAAAGDVAASIQVLSAAFTAPPPAAQ